MSKRKNKHSKKSNKLSTTFATITSILIAAGVIGGTYYLTTHSQKNVDKQNNKTSNNIVNGNHITLASWNIANLSTKSVPKGQYRLNAIRDVINNNNLDILSIQELSFNESEPLDRIVKSLGDNWSYQVSPRDVFSKERPNSKEAFGIIYRNDKIKYLNESDVYYGQDVKFTRPLWYSKWQILQDKQTFWIINGHLDAPGQSSTAGVNESNSPVIENYKWSNQGDQEVKEYLDIKNILKDLKSKYPNDLIIFNGDTNIKKEHFSQARDYYKKLGYETNYESSKYQQEYATSLGNNGYANPYDKIIAYDPNQTFEGDKFIKYDLYSHINDKNRNEYQKWYKQQYNVDYIPSDEKLVDKISDHTLIKAIIMIKKDK